MTTRVLVLCLLGTFAYGAPQVNDIEETIHLDNGLSRGDWGPPDICKTGSFAFAVEIKYAALGHVDDTAVNAVKLYCEDASGSLTGDVVSTEGKWGSWEGIRACKAGEYLVGMRGNVVKEQGSFSDDLGLDNVQVRCSDGTILDGLNGVFLKEDEDYILSLEEEKEEEDKDISLTKEEVVIDGRPMEAIHVNLDLGDKVGDHGDWSSWTECSTGLRICGIETRLERESTLTDDAGTSDMMMYCCSY